LKSNSKVSKLEKLYDELNESILQEMSLDFDEQIKELEY
jgi:hypothetical protein